MLPGNKDRMFIIPGIMCICVSGLVVYRYDVLTVEICSRYSLGVFVDDGVVSCLDTYYYC